jgi:hypothetical protein
VARVLVSGKKSQWSTRNPREHIYKEFRVTDDDDDDDDDYYYYYYY